MAFEISLVRADSLTIQNKATKGRVSLPKGSQIENTYPTEPRMIYLKHQSDHVPLLLEVLPQTPCPLRVQPWFLQGI